MFKFDRDLNDEKNESVKQERKFSFLSHMPQFGSMFNPQKVSAKISVIYIIIGCLWILFSDRIVNILVHDKNKIEFISMIKGWFFVIASGLVIYILIYYTMKRIRKAEKKVIESYDELSATYKVLETSFADSKLNQETIKHLAYYDTLTDLPNRVLFIDRLVTALKLAKHNNAKIAVLFFDIDNFKKINDIMGHYIGDKLLIDISNKLKSSLEANETLARFSGDEFSMFIENISSTEEIMIFIDKIKKVFENPFNAGNHTFHISSSFGISIFPDHGEIVEELLKNADTAMYKAKETRKNNHQFYDDNLRDEVLRKLQIEKHLINALEKNEFYLCFQPQVDSKSYEIRGFEALLRWNNGKIGSISPLEFIPIAEETGLIITIGEWVLEKACETIKTWQENYGSNMVISVNISPIQLKQDNFPEIVKEILYKTGLNPELLELEITENVFIESFDIVDMLWELKNMGVKISLDDFGTGFSSLNYLTKLPLNTLKIDKVFVNNIKTGSKEKAVIESIISLIHKLNLEVIAEGVETKEQLEYLIESNCDNIQGFLFCKPLIEGELIDIIKDPRGWFSRTI